MNGAMALWLDGRQVIHLRQNSPTGTWVHNMFPPGVGGTPFEGFRWRAIDLLKLNWVSLQHYTSENPQGFGGRVWWDHLVLAKKYAGPISTSGSPPASPTGVRVW